MAKWEYCIVSTPPPGPVEVYVTLYTPEGYQRTIHRSENYNHGAQVVWPSIIADMGLQGWELSHVGVDGAWYMRRAISDDET